MFNCQWLADEERWHRDDLRINCDDSVHALFQVIAGAFIFVYPVGIPVVFFAQLRRDDRQRAEGTRTSKDANTKTSSFDFLRKDCASTASALLSCNEA